MIRENLRPALAVILLLAGTFSIAREDEIIDGEAAKDGEYPAVVYLHRSSRAAGGAEGWDGSCTGFFVHPKLVLSAAHCFDGGLVDLVTNDPKAKSRGRKFRIDRTGSYPGYVTPTSESTQEERRLAASTDIGYVVLKEEIPAEDFVPYPIYPSLDSASMLRLRGREATLVGYGATKWESSGDYTHAGTGVKRIGKKPINDVHYDFIRLNGEKAGGLPGDSGGPILVEIDGETKVAAIVHGMHQTQIVPDLDRKGNPKIGKDGKPKTKEVRGYDSTSATLLTEKNLCWVEAASKIDIAGVDCPPLEKTEKK